VSVPVAAAAYVEDISLPGITVIIRKAVPFKVLSEALEEELGVV